MRLIASITNTYPAVVTTTFDHEYISGLVIRMHIPIACGMPELSSFVGEISVLSNTSFSLDIDTTNFTVFAIPVAPVPPWLDTCAQVIPVGEDNDMLTEATRNRS
jgi:tryptophanyl-tRNA synthetase